MSLARFASLALAFALLPTLAHAQGGCINSPECPTAVLASVGLAGALIFPRIRRR